MRDCGGASDGWNWKERSTKGLVGIGQVWRCEGAGVDMRVWVGVRMVRGCCSDTGSTDWSLKNVSKVGRGAIRAARDEYDDVKEDRSETFG